MKNKCIVLLAILLLLSGLAYAGDFRCEKIGQYATNYYGNMIITPGRNDSVNRIYVSGRVPYELTWNGSLWEKDSLDTTFMGVSSIAAGFGRNDGIWRLYIGDMGARLWEYSYNGLTWDKVLIDDRWGLYTFAVALGNIKNDDTIRVVAGGDDSTTIAYTYQQASGTWDKDTLGVKRWHVSNIEIGKGRNDDTNRVYTGGLGFWVEYTFRAQWDTTHHSGDSYYMTIDKLKKDSLNRLYLSSNGFSENYWNGTKWVDTIGALDTFSCKENISAAARSDLIKRLYICSRKNMPLADAINANIYVHEYSHDTLAGWTKKILTATIWNPEGYPRNTMRTLTAGNGRNDAKNRIYSLCDNGELFEWTWDDTLNGVEQENVKVVNELKVRKVLKVKPNPFYSYTGISNLPSDIELKIYDITGRLVEKTNSTKVGDKLKAGVYFVTAGGYKPAKMVKIK
jgi:hypothetical protein